MNPFKQRELGVLLASVLAAALFGLAIGQLWFAVAVVLGGFVIAFASNLFKLHDWLTHRSEKDLPEASGLWGEVFNEIYLMERETGQHRAALSDTLHRFQEAAEALPDGMVILSSDNRIQWSNPVAMSLAGIRYPRDVGQPISNLLRHPRFQQYLHQKDFSTPLELPSPAKAEHLLTLQIIPYGADQKLIMLRDITFVHKLEEMRSQFVANVSHELRSPITVLSGYLETLKDMPNADPRELSKALNNMHEQAKRMERLVTDLLALSRLETEPTQKHEPVDVPAMLASLKETAELLSGDKKHVITLNAEADVSLIGNREELHSLFSNLISNAVRYTPPGGLIDIVWHRVPDGVEFFVTDSGQGIAPQHLTRLTERFYRVDVDRSRQSGGTGLGLAIVKHVLDRHDGQLHIDSELGQGSTFRCLFPKERLAASAA